MREPHYSQKITEGEKKDGLGSVLWKFKDIYTKYEDHETETKEGFSNTDGNQWKSQRDTYFSEQGEQTYNSEVK